MADRSTKRLEFIERRASALAVMYLTRREDLTVEPARSGVGLDLLVHILPHKKAGIREFGVEVEGIWESVTPERANKALRSKMQRLTEHGPFPFPVVLFIFTMEETRAWYTWVAEPVVSPDGNPTLQMHEEANCKPLDNDALVEIVNAVNRWYDAFYQALTTAGRVRDNGASGDGR